MLIILSVFCSYMISNLFCVCKGDKKKKKKSGSGSSTSSNSRSSTPTIATDGAANTIAAAATKLSQDRPGTPCKYIPTIFRVRRWNCMEWPYKWNLFSKTFVRYYFFHSILQTSILDVVPFVPDQFHVPRAKTIFWIVWVFAAKSKKRPASASKKGTPGEEGSPASKKPRVSPAPSAGGAEGGSRTSTPKPSGSEEGPQGITEEAVRRYLTRKPMTSKDLLQKFKSKRTGLSNDDTVKKLAAIVRKIQPEQKTIKGKLCICRLNHRAEMCAREGRLFRPILA